MTSKNRDIFAEALASDEGRIMPHIAKISREIEKFLEVYDLSQKEFASRLKKSPAYVSRLMRGDYNLTLSSIDRLYEAMGSKFSLPDAINVRDAGRDGMGRVYFMDNVSNIKDFEQSRKAHKKATHSDTFESEATLRMAE